MTKIHQKLNITRMTALVLALFVLLPLLPVPAAAADNSCGSALSWNYNAGTLTITGSGDMYNYYDGSFAPWYEFREDIIRVSLPEELTTIGSFAFIGCKNLKQISIPYKVKVIGDYAFASCEKLTSVNLSNQLKTIGKSAFYNCLSINAIPLPYGLEEIGDKAFYRCKSLTAVVIPGNVAVLGSSVFAYCTNLVRAEINAPLAALPAWTFFGCNMLTELSLKETVAEIENNAFEDCDSLTNIYYPAENQQSESLIEQIARDVPSFGSTGYVSDSTISDSTTGGDYVENEDNSGTQTNITVWQSVDYILEATVTRKMENGAFLNEYSVALQLTLENQSAWDSSIEQLKSAVSGLQDYIGKNAYTLKVYLKNDAVLSDKLTKLLTGVDVKLEVMSASGSVWRVNGKDLAVKEEETIEAAPPAHDYSYTVEDASQEVKDQVGTDDCFQLTFTESMDGKAEILIQLPPAAAAQGSTAYLYQIEDDGEHTRLQAVWVDDDSVAHFYLSNTDKDTQYVIGVNVPNETVEDAIVPDELLTGDRFSAIARLEEIEYVSTGRRELNGMGLGEIMMFTLVGLALTVIVVGTVMFFWNKKRLEQQNAMRRMKNQ